MHPHLRTERLDLIPATLETLRSGRQTLASLLNAAVPPSWPPPLLDDEALAGFCTRVDVTIHPDNSVTVDDNGRGIPVGIVEKEGRSALEVVLTVLHAGGKFGDGSGYKVSGGLHGVGVSVVNALSEWLELVVWRDETEYRARFEDGDCTIHVHEVGPAPGMRGTEVRFLASAKINRPNGTFSNLDYSFKTLENRLRELAFLNSGVRIIFRDLRGPEPFEEILFYEGGVKAYVAHLDRSRSAVIPEAIYVIGERDGMTVEASMQWNDGYHENTLCFTNNIPQKDGGTHLAGFRAALTSSLNDWARKAGVLKGSDGNLSGDDVREGLTAVISV